MQLTHFTLSNTWSGWFSLDCRGVWDKLGSSSAGELGDINLLDSKNLIIQHNNLKI